MPALPKKSQRSWWHSCAAVLILCISGPAFAQARERLLLELPTQTPDGRSTQALKRAVTLYLTDLVELTEGSESGPVPRLRLVVTFVGSAADLEARLEVRAQQVKHTSLTSVWPDDATGYRALGLRLRSLLRVGLYEEESVTSDGVSSSPTPSLPMWALEVGGAPEVTSLGSLSGQVVAAARRSSRAWSVALEVGLTLALPTSVKTGTARTFLWHSGLTVRWVPWHSDDGRWLGFLGLEAGATLVHIGAVNALTQTRASGTAVVPMVGAHAGVTRRVMPWPAFSVAPGVEFFPVDVMYTVFSLPVFRSGPIRARVDLRAVFLLFQ